MSYDEEGTGAIAPMEITQALAQKVLAVVDAGLIGGAVIDFTPGQLCVEAAICYALGEVNTTASCVSILVNNICKSINDLGKWASPEERAKGMRRLAVGQLGSDGINEKEFSAYVVDQAVRRIFPLLLKPLIKAAAHEEGQANQLIAASVKCKTDGDPLGILALPGKSSGYSNIALLKRAVTSTLSQHWQAPIWLFAACVWKAPIHVVKVACDIVLEGLQRQNCPGCKFLELTN